MVAPFFLDEVRELNLEVAAELPEDLAARAARRRRRFRVGDDRDAREHAVPLGDRLEHRDTLGADCQAVRGVLDVAARDHTAVDRLEGGAHFEMRERRGGMFAGMVWGMVASVALYRLYFRVRPDDALGFK